MRSTLGRAFILVLFCMNAIPAASETTPCDLTILGPDPVFVQYGGNLTLNCTTTCETIEGGKGWESSLRKEEVKKDTYWISTNFIDITEWVSVPECFIIDSSGGTRTSRATIVAYRAPKDVGIDLLSEMLVGQSYPVTCRALNIAPKRNLTVSVREGNETLYTESYPNDLTNNSTNVTVSYTITAQRRNHRAEYTCLAQLDLTPNGGLFEASSATVSVSIVGPPINVNLSTDRTEFVKGDNFTVSCYAEGNPPAALEWLLPTNESTQISDNGTSVTVFSAQSMHNGTYECRARNQYGSSTAKVDILWKGDDLSDSFPAWKTFLIIVGCLVATVTVVFVCLKFFR